MDAAAAGVALVLLEVDQDRHLLPPELPVGDGVVPPAADDAQAVGGALRDAESCGPEDEPNAQGLDSEEKAED